MSDAGRLMAGEACSELLFLSQAARAAVRWLWRPGEAVVPMEERPCEPAALWVSGVEGSSSVGVALWRLRVKGRRGTGRTSKGPSSDMLVCGVAEARTRFGELAARRVRDVAV